MNNVREWLWDRLMRDFTNGGSFEENGRKHVWDDSTPQWFEWTKIPQTNVKSWLKTGQTSCTSFLAHVHRHIVDEGGFRPAAHWQVLPNLKGKGYHEGTQGIQSCDFFQFCPNHVGVFLGAIGSFAGYLAGGDDRQGVGRLTWTVAPIPPANYKFWGYLNIEEFYT